MVVQPEWLTPEDVTVPQAEEMVAFLVSLVPGHTRLPPVYPRNREGIRTRESLAPLSLVHVLMVSPFLAPATVWHMMHVKSDAVGMTHQVAPFFDWLKEETVDPLQGIAALTSVDLADATLA